MEQQWQHCSPADREGKFALSGCSRRQAAGEHVLQPQLVTTGRKTWPLGMSNVWWPLCYGVVVTDIGAVFCTQWQQCAVASDSGMGTCPQEV